MPNSPKATSALKRHLEEVRIKHTADLMHELHDSLRKLDAADPQTLSICISTLTENSVEQVAIAELLATSRTQVGRWQAGTHVPRQPGFRVWLVEQLLEFMRGYSATLPPSAVVTAMPGQARQRNERSSPRR